VECTKWEEQRKKPQQTQVAALFWYILFCLYVFFVLLWDERGKVMIKNLRLDYEWIYDDSGHGDKIEGLVGSITSQSLSRGKGKTGQFIRQMQGKINNKYLGNCQSN